MRVISSRAKWIGYLETAIKDVIKNEIIDASCDGQVKPSQYVDGCIKSIMSQISFNDAVLTEELIKLTDHIGFDEGKHLEKYNECFERIANNCVCIESKYV